LIDQDLFKVDALLQVFHKKELVYYTSVITGVHGNKLTILAPVSAKGTLDMPSGSLWEMRLIGEDALYIFDALVLGKNKRERLEYVVRRPSAVHRRQRRW